MAKKVTKRTSKRSVKRTAKKPVRRTARKVVRRVKTKTVRKAVRKSSKKSSPKVASIRLSSLSVKSLCNPCALGGSLAIVGGITSFIISALGFLGHAQGLNDHLGSILFMYGLTVAGAIGGIVELAVYGYVIGYVLAWCYNKILE